MALARSCSNEERPDWMVVNVDRAGGNLDTADQ